jgi:hypothetical protein
MGLNKDVNFRLIEHHKSKTNAQLLVINGRVNRRRVKNSGLNRTRFDKSSSNNLLGHTVNSQLLGMQP